MRSWKEELLLFKKVVYPHHNQLCYRMEHGKKRTKFQVVGTSYFSWTIATDKFPWGTLRVLHQFLNIWVFVFFFMYIYWLCNQDVSREKQLVWITLEVSNMIFKFALLVVENIFDMLWFTEDIFITTVSCDFVGCVWFFFAVIWRDGLGLTWHFTYSTTAKFSIIFIFFRIWGYANALTFVYST